MQFKKTTKAAVLEATQASEVEGLRDCRGDWHSRLHGAYLRTNARGARHGQQSGRYYPKELVPSSEQSNQGKVLSEDSLRAASRDETKEQKAPAPQENEHRDVQAPTEESIAEARTIQFDGASAKTLSIQAEGVTVGAFRIRLGESDDGFQITITVRAVSRNTSGGADEVGDETKK